MHILLAPQWQEQAEDCWLGQELKGTGFFNADHAWLWRTQALLRHDLGYNREDREFSTQLGEESVDVYLAWLAEEGELHPVVAKGYFRWEMSRLSVRISWLRKKSGEFSLPGDEVL